MHVKTLYLLRHAKAEAGGKLMSDEGRKLAPRGHEACELMGNRIKQKLYVPELALVSPAARTMETVESIMRASGKTWKVKKIQALYLASSETILQEIHHTDNNLSALMVVGHNPGMHHAALDLSSSEDTILRHELEMKYPTGSLTVLRFSVEHWTQIQPGMGEIIDFITPAGQGD